MENSCTFIRIKSFTFPVANKEIAEIQSEIDPNNIYYLRIRPSWKKRMIRFSGLVSRDSDRSFNFQNEIYDTKGVNNHNIHYYSTILALYFCNLVGVKRAIVNISLKKVYDLIISRSKYSMDNSFKDELLKAKNCLEFVRFEYEKDSVNYVEENESRLQSPIRQAESRDSSNRRRDLSDEPTFNKRNAQFRIDASPTPKREHDPNTGCLRNETRRTQEDLKLMQGMTNIRPNSNRFMMEILVLAEEYRKKIDQLYLHYREEDIRDESRNV